MINKPANISSKIWASLGDLEAPTDAKLELGWMAEVPKAQIENWSQNRQDTFNAHVNERGIAEWDATTDYIAGKSYVQGSNGLVYQCAISSGPTTTPRDPVSNTTNGYWVQAFVTSLQGTQLQNRVTNLETGKQDNLVSGSNIKTVNGSSVLGSGDLVITGSPSEASNIGDGEGVYAGRVGDDLQFKSVKAGTGVTVTSDSDSITITADGGGGGSQTDLGIGTRTDTTVEVTSSTGSGANLPAVTSSLAGVMTAADKVKLDNANLTALVGLTGAEDQLPYFTGAGALSLTTLTAAARTLLAATNAAGQQSAMGLGSAATWDSVPDASSTVVGGLKVRLDGTTLYMTNDGSDA